MFCKSTDCPLVGTKERFIIAFKISEYFYDVLSRVSYIKNTENGRIFEAFGYLYNVRGQKTFMLEDNGDAVRYVYDNAGRLSEVYSGFAKKHAAAVEERKNNGLSAGGNTSPSNLAFTGSDYSDLSNIYNAIQSNNGNFNPENKQYFHEKYSYDQNSNIVQIQNNIGTIDHSYDAENRLIQKGSASFSYDDNGNLLKKTDGKDKTYYTYNAANRLIKAVKPITPNEKELRVAEYQYDALGRKLSRFMYEEHSGTAKKGGYSVYGYNGKGLDLSYKIDYDYNPNSAFTALFQREYLKVNGMIISQREIELPRYFDERQTRFLFTDALGSVTSVKSVKGGDEKIRYDAWGGFLEKYGRTGHIEEYSKRGVLLGYNGQPYDNFTGLYNYGYRHLDTDSKQWLTQDPIRDGSNWQAYLGGVADPVNYVDLWGLEAGDPFDTPQEAAEDWALTYNDDSIVNDVEYGSTIYSYNNNVGNEEYSYNLPNTGTSGGVMVNTSLEDGQTPVSTIHSHGAYEPDPDGGINYAGMVPSPQDHIHASKNKVLSYMTNPKGELRAYDGRPNKSVLIRDDLPSDKNHPLNNGFIAQYTYVKNKICSFKDKIYSFFNPRPVNKEIADDKKEK